VEKGPRSGWRRVGFSNLAVAGIAVQVIGNHGSLSEITYFDFGNYVFMPTASHSNISIWAGIINSTE
jgi:hypothetical protein